MKEAVIDHMLGEMKAELQDEIDFLVEEVQEEYQDWLTCHRWLVWMPDDCEYDRSGKLIDLNLVEAAHSADTVADILIDLETHPCKPEECKTLGDYLEHFTGEWEPTFESGMGKRYQTYGDRLHEALSSLVWSHLEEKYGTEVDEVFGFYDMKYDLQIWLAAAIGAAPVEVKTE